MFPTPQVSNTNDRLIETTFLFISLIVNLTKYFVNFIVPFWDFPMRTMDTCLIGTLRSGFTFWGLIWTVWRDFTLYGLIWTLWREFTLYSLIGTLWREFTLYGLIWTLRRDFMLYGLIWTSDVSSRFAVLFGPYDASSRCTVLLAPYDASSRCTVLFGPYDANSRCMEDLGLWKWCLTLFQDLRGRLSTEVQAVFCCSLRCSLSSEWSNGNVPPMPLLL